MEAKSNPSDTAVAATTENTPTLTKKVPKSKAKMQRTKSTHPPTSEMVSSAIKELNDRKGSSLQAIKKYIVATYKVDGEKVAPFIKRYLKTAVTSGTVVQTKGKGASGSFKLSSSKTPEGRTKTQRLVKGAKASAATGSKSVEKRATATAKKAAESKKAKPTKKSEAPKSPAQKKAAAKQSVAIAAEKKGAKKPAQPKNLSKTKKTAKAPAAKTRTPKPKKAATPKVVKTPTKK